MEYGKTKNRKLRVKILSCGIYLWLMNYSFLFTSIKHGSFDQYHSASSEKKFRVSPIDQIE